jgi:hypothetical protein
VVQLLKKLIGQEANSKNKLKSQNFSTKTNKSMLLVLPRVKDFQAQQKDSEQKDYQERPTEVLEESDVSVLGIQKESPSPSQELVN